MSMRSAPDFALSFSSDAVHLMERADLPAAASVRWREKAVAAFDAPDFRAEMARLRKLVANGPDARVALIIPDDQILYTSLPVAGEVRRNADLGQALDGLTPYPVTDLAWDWRPDGEGDVRVAAVARQTLREAEDFARRHGFAAEGFLADPPEGVFPATPQFSDSMWKDAASLSDTDLPGDAAAEDIQRELPEATEIGTAVQAEAAEDDRPDQKDAESAVLSRAHEPEGTSESAKAVQTASSEDAGASTDDVSGAREDQPAQGGSDEHEAVPPAGVTAEEDVAERVVPSSALPEEGGQAPATSPSKASGIPGAAGLDMDQPGQSSHSDHAIESRVGTVDDQAPAAGLGTSGGVMVASDRPALGETDTASDKGSPADAEAPESASQAPEAAVEQRSGTAAMPANPSPATATPEGRTVLPGAPGATSRLVADRASPPRPTVPVSERMRVAPERPAKIEPGLDVLAAYPGRHPGARGGIGGLLVMLGALLLGLLLIWAFATPGREGAPTAALPASGAMESEAPTSPAQENDATAPAAEAGATQAPAPVSETPVTQGATATAEALANAASPAVSAPATPAASSVEPAPTASPLESPASPVREAVPTATPAQVPATGATAASRDQAGSTAASPENEAAHGEAAAVPAGSVPAQMPSARAPTEEAPAPQAPVPADAATAGADAGSAANVAPAGESATDQTALPASAPTAASTPAATTDSGQGTGTSQAEGPSAAGSGAAPAAPATRPSNAPRRPARVEAPPPAQADQLPAVVPGRSALTRSERPSSRPATVRTQPSRATAAERPATTERAAATPPAASRPSPARPEAAPRAAPRPAATAPARPSSERPRPRPEEGSADESVTAAEMTAEERVSADLMLADLYAVNPWLPRLSTAPELRGQRVAEARPAKRPGGSKSAVDAAIAEAVSAKPAATAQGDRPVRRQSAASESKPAAQAAAPVKAAANTNGRPAARPARGGSKPAASSAVESAVAEAVATASRPATLASAASLVPVRKPARPAASDPAKDAQAEAVALAAATAIRSRPDPAPPAAAPAAPAAPAAAQPAPSETAQRLRDEELQRQAEERARLRAQADAQAELQARAAAEARARAQAEAEERAAIAARGTYRPPEIDDEPEIAQKPVEGRTSADVAKNATVRGIETNKTQVIGVIGAGRASRGLIRLRNGKIVTVRLGDRIDGGAINSIGNGKISYVKGGRTYNLPILNGR